MGCSSIARAPLSSLLTLGAYGCSLFQIVETVWNSNVDNIDQAEVDSFYASVPVADLELLVGKAVVNQGRSRSSSPIPITEEGTP